MAEETVHTTRSTQMLLDDLKGIKDFEKVRVVSSYILDKNANEYHFVVILHPLKGPQKIGVGCDNGYEYGSRTHKRVVENLVWAFNAEKEPFEGTWYKLKTPMTLDAIAQGIERTFHTAPEREPPRVSRRIRVDYVYD